MKTSTIVALLLVAVVITFANALESVPALVWSGKREMSKFTSLRDSLSSSNTVAVFLHHELGSQEFLENSGAFSIKPDENNAFVYLKKAMKSSNSASFPNLSEDQVQSVLPSEFTFTISDSNVAGSVALTDFLASPENYLKKGGKYLFVFADVHRSDAKVRDLLSKYDTVIQNVVYGLDKLTEGDYVALFSAQKPTMASLNSRHILSASDSQHEYSVYASIEIQNMSTVYNGTLNTMYIDSEIAVATVIGLFLVFWLVVSVVALMKLKTAPHLTGLDVFDEKKHN